MPLKATIQQWKERNEVTRMKVARAALSLASTESMVLEALKDLHISHTPRTCTLLFCYFQMLARLAVLLLFSNVIFNSCKRVTGLVGKEE